MTILLTQALRVGGVVLNSGTTQTFGADLEADIVARKGATYLTDPTPGKTVPVFATTDVTGGRRLSMGNNPLGPLLRNTPVRIATFGDSTANFGGTQGSGGSANQQDTTQLIPDAWNSGTKSFGISINKLAVDFYYPKAYIVGDGGVPGETTTQMLARDTAGASVTRKAITDIINLNPDVVIFRGGSINDLLTVTSGTVAATVTASYANHIALLNRFMSANIPVIDEGIYGFTNGTSNTATDQASTRSALTQLNTLYAAYAQQYPDLLKFISPVGVLSDSTGAYLTASTDGTHLNVSGQLALGQMEAALIEQWYGVSSNIRFPGTNVVANALMSNVTAGTANGFTVAATVASVANKKVEQINGKWFQTAEWTLASGTNIATINMPYDPTTMAILVNDVYGFEFDIYFMPMNGYVPTPGNLTITAQCRTVNTVGSGDVYLNRMGAGTTGYGDLSKGFQGHVGLTPVKYGDVSANFTVGSRFQVVIQTTDSVGMFKMGVSEPRIVKLNQAVVTM